MPEIAEIGSYDVIVVGAGMAGLMAANGLAKRNHRVLLLEKHAVPGGCTTNFERGEFRFEGSTHVINGCGPGGMTYRQLERVGAHDRLEFIELRSFGHVVDETRGTEFDLPWALDEHVEMLVGQFPDEETGIRRFYEKYGKMADTLVASLAGSSEEDGELQERLAAAGQDYLALQGKKANEILDDYVTDPQLVELMTAIPSGFTGTPYDELDASTCIMADLIFRANGGDAYYPKGGSGHMTQVLADLFEESGGDLRLKHGATEITFAGGRVTGVVARRGGGRHVSARARCVVTASDLTFVVNDLCAPGTLPADYVKAVNERVPGISAVILFAGLDIDLRQRGITDFEISRNWGEAGGLSFFGESARTGDYAKLPSASVTVYSNIDPTCCPPGKSLVATMALAEPELYERSLDSGRKRGRAYKALKERITAQLLEKLERALGIDDLRRHVEVLELATPITFERYTSNRGGAYVGWKYSAEQAQAHFPQQSPVENLFHCGHWVAPGAGVGNVIAGGNDVADLVDRYLLGG